MPTTKKFLDSDGLVQYTTLVKREISNAADDHKVKHNSESGSSSLPILTSHQSNPSNGNNYEAGFDTALTYKPNEKEVTVTSGSNVVTIKPTEVNVADGTNRTVITASGITLPNGAKPNITKTTASGSHADQLSVTVGGQTSSAVELTTASATVKGVVLVDSSLSNSSANPVQNQAVDSAVKAAAKTVRQSAQTGSTALPILVSAQATPTSGNNYEAGYDADLKYNPSTNTLTIGDGTLSPTAFSGHANATESDLGSTATGKGADMVAYTSNDSVKDALDDIYGQIGSGGGGNSLTDRVEALEDAVDDLDDNKQDKDFVVAITHDAHISADKTFQEITSAYNAGKRVYAVTTAGGGVFALHQILDDRVVFSRIFVHTLGSAYQGTTSYYCDSSNNWTIFSEQYDRVKQTEVSSNTDYPMLLASSASPTSGSSEYTGYDTDLKYNPSTNTLKIGTGTLTATNWSGNAATATSATNDGSGNNIVNTYATKSALDALSNKWTGQFKIASSAEATAIAQGNASSLELGYIYLVEDTSASSPNVYNEYIKVAKGTDPETYAVEKIGTTDAGVDVVSLTTAEINTIWSTTAAAS